MSAPTEPLVSVLMQGRVLCMVDESGQVHSIEFRLPRGYHWPEPGKRDDAAELRAALERIERMVSPDNKGWASGATRLNHAHLIAQYALKVLPHQQEAALRAALAATEEES